MLAGGLPTRPTRLAECVGTISVRSVATYWKPTCVEGGNGGRRADFYFRVCSRAECEHQNRKAGWLVTVVLQTRTVAIRNVRNAEFMRARV